MSQQTDSQRFSLYSCHTRINQAQVPEVLPSTTTHKSRLLLLHRIADRFSYIGDGDASLAPGPHTLFARLFGLASRMRINRVSSVSNPQRLGPGSRHPIKALGGRANTINGKSQYLAKIKHRYGRVSLMIYTIVTGTASLAPSIFTHSIQELKVRGHQGRVSPRQSRKVPVCSQLAQGP
jgi:hypothetical protein